jgi:hypothetical protein
LTCAAFPTGFLAEKNVSKKGIGKKWDVEKLLKNTFLQPRHTKNYALDLIHQRERNSF